MVRWKKLFKGVCVALFLKEVKNLQFYSQLSLKQVEDRLLITADFPKEFRIENQLHEPFLYVTLYVRGGARIKIIDEGTANIYTLTKKEIDPATYKKIIQFAIDHAPQFKNLSKQ
ncbi:hypothetical protein MUN89_08510 [Halobacillus salinarum]|uniref:Uncharacterized protein n=1 Tax=Halobacillus salinarum TaxID=2932257 RepID=A0ABY4EQ07_9BACI|nr:hypothetical protein [Halobacillus salinarum]UOQ45948.1 hypothetical protein MUN89_08510 [Halobacillus salinarum]